MKIILFAKGVRGLECCKALFDAGADICALVLHPNSEEKLTADFSEVADKNQCPVLDYENSNESQAVSHLSTYQADLHILAGYGKILKKEMISLPRVMTLNLHAGKLPEYRGSSPLNWCLIHGKREFTLSIIRVDSGIDTGEILAETTHAIAPHHTIKDLHEVANKEFPRMLIQLLQEIRSGKSKGRIQNQQNAAYFPRRFSEDGLILWDQHTAEEVHALTRALTDPYPCAFSFYEGIKIFIKRTSYTQIPFCGVSGRIYRISEGRILIAAKDRAIWIEEAKTEDGRNMHELVKRYDQCLTLRSVALQHVVNNQSNHMNKGL